MIAIEPTMMTNSQNSPSMTRSRTPYSTGEGR